MTLGLPIHLARHHVAIGYTRAGQATGAVCLAVTFLIAAALAGDSPELVVWPALLALLPAAAMLAWVIRDPSPVVVAAYQVVGAGSLYWYSVTLLTQYPLTAEHEVFTLVLLTFALVLACPPAGAWAMAGWAASGLLLAESAVRLAEWQSQVTAGVDVSPIALAAGWAVSRFIADERIRRGRQRLGVVRAGRDEHVAAVRQRIEIAAAALLHDTVLNHLAVIAATRGRIPAEMRERMRRDVELLVGQEWLSDAPTSTDDDQAGGLFDDALAGARALGLTVQVSGELRAGRLSAAQAAALALAVRQCLANVAHHARTDRAELVLCETDEEVTIMVVDAGRGFDLGTAGRDRLGLRTSVHRRIEEVGGSARVWSAPGRGTSVIIRLPVQSPARQD